MYVRFKIRRRKTGPARRNFTYHVVLVESKRQSGEPRQRIIAYLGSIRSEYFELPQKRYRFLKEMRDKVDTLDFDYWTRWDLKLKIMRLFQKQGGFREGG